MPDMISVLIQDHRDIEELFLKAEANLTGSTDQAEKARPYSGQIIAKLVQHASVEEMYLYPTARKTLPDGDKIADRDINDHDEIEKVLAEVEKKDLSTEKFAILMRALIHDTRAHIQDEEAFLFPKLRQALTPQELNDLGRKIEAAKKTAPTQPHPSAPDKPSLIDRIKNFIANKKKNK